MLAGPPERVWALLTDASELARAMPGAGEVEPEDGCSFRTTSSLAVGPVKDSFEGRLAYEDEQPPTACTIVVETKGKSGHVAGRGAMRLEPRDGGSTLLHYEGDFKVSGPVAGVGQRMIAGVARKTIERTLDGIGRRLSEETKPTVEEEAAVSTAFWHPFANMARVAGKELVISRGYAYHGLHAWGTSLGGIPANVECLGPLVADVVHVDASSADDLAAAIDRLGAERVAAFIGEPVVGAGGVLPPPEGYWTAVAELCREQDVLLIADEVITGFGRLGCWFGCERFGFTPDLLVFAKGVSSGYMPLGGVVVGPRVQEPFWRGEGTWFRHGYTYSGHAAACAAGIANLDILERERLVERVAELEALFAEKVHSLAEHPLVGETRAIGLVGAVELAAAELEREPELVERAVALAPDPGVLTRALRGCALHLSPPFIIEPEQIDALVDGLRQALEAIQDRRLAPG